MESRMPQVLSGFLDCREKDLLQKEETEAIMGIKITGENFDTATKNFVEDKEEISIKVDDALVGKKKNMLLLSLDYEGVISAWAEKKRPWLIGDRRPELNLDDWWPQCMEIVNDGDIADNVDSSEGENDVGEEPGDEDAKEE